MLNRVELVDLHTSYDQVWLKLEFSAEENAMQFALLIYESPEAFATRKNDENGPYRGAWRAYYKALVDACVYVGGDPLEVPETGTTLRLEGLQNPGGVPGCPGLWT
jgi:hypothetical protein